MQKRVIVFLTAVILAVFLCGCSWEQEAIADSYEEGFYAGVAAANEADTACLFEGPGVDIGVQAEILDSYLNGDGIYTYADAKDAIDSLYHCYDELMKLYGEIEDGCINVDYPS